MEPIQASAPSQAPIVLKAISSIIDVSPWYSRYTVVRSDGISGSYWLNRSILEANQEKYGTKGFTAVEKSIGGAVEDQSLFREIEVSFLALVKCAEELGLGEIEDRAVTERDPDAVKVRFALTASGGRLCSHAVAHDGMTRLYMTRSGGDEGLDWRLELYSEEEGIEELGSGTVADDDLSSDRRPADLRWALSCLSGPVVRPPIAH